MKGIFYLFPMPGVELTRCTIVAGRPRQAARHKLALKLNVNVNVESVELIIDNDMD